MHVKLLLGKPKEMSNLEIFQLQKFAKICVNFSVTNYEITQVRYTISGSVLIIKGHFMKVYSITLHYRIKARDGINTQGGRSPNFNKCTVLNKHTGWKKPDGINTQCNFYQYTQNLPMGLNGENG